MEGIKLFTNRVYGVQIIKSKNSNYNADFTGAPRTLPNGTVYATDKVSKFNDRRYIGRNDDSLIFTKTTYKSDLKPMVLKEVFESHFGPISEHTKITALSNLLSKIDVRIFGATFAPKGADNMNLSIHGPVQVSYGINQFTESNDSGVFTDQIGSPYASKDGADQTTLGSQTRSQEAHYVHHFSINPKNLSLYIEQIFRVTKSHIENCIKKTGKGKDKKQELDISKVEELKKFYNFSETFEKENYEQFIEFVRKNEEKIKEAFFHYFQLLKEDDIQQLKEAMALATTYYDSTSKKDSENELLMWIELKDDSEKILKNFSDEINIENGIFKIKDVLENYILHFATDIKKIEIAYDKFNTTIDLDYSKEKDNEKFQIRIINYDTLKKDGYDAILKEISAPKNEDKFQFIIYEDLNLIKDLNDKREEEKKSDNGKSSETSN